jgi:hypothetical protein
LIDQAPSLQPSRTSCEWMTSEVSNPTMDDEPLTSDGRLACSKCVDDGWVRELTSTGPNSKLNIALSKTKGACGSYKVSTVQASSWPPYVQ